MSCDPPEKKQHETEAQRKGRKLHAALVAAALKGPKGLPYRPLMYFPSTRGYSKHPALRRRGKKK